MSLPATAADPFADGEVPSWDPDLCVQCGRCVIACPHAAIRAGLLKHATLSSAPTGFKSRKALHAGREGLRYTIQISPSGCSGCGICVETCPARNPSDKRIKALRMRRESPWHLADLRSWEFLLSASETGPGFSPPSSTRTLQFRPSTLSVGRPCAGCGQTPYLHLLSRLFGDHVVIARCEGHRRSPRCSRLISNESAADAISLRVELDQLRAHAEDLLARLAPDLGQLAWDILAADQSTGAGIAEQRRRIGALKRCLQKRTGKDERDLERIAHALVRRTIWAVTNRYPSDIERMFETAVDVNFLILDEGSDTVATNIDLAAVRSERAYVASIALFARDDHAIGTLLEAAAHDGPSLVFALGSCPADDRVPDIRAHRLAVESGAWLLFRHDPSLRQIGAHPFRFDSPQPRENEGTLSGRAREVITRRWQAFHDISRSRAGKPTKDHQ